MKSEQECILSQPRMRYEVITLFPEIIETYVHTGVLGKAIEKGIIEVEIYNLRDFCTDKHRQVDDYPYGGGPGMVIKPEPVFRAIEFLKSDQRQRKIFLLSPSGRVFTQNYAKKLVSEYPCITLLSGRYEGFDYRVLEVVHEEISIGDYILTGGELAALVIIDATARLVPGVLGDERSVEEESFTEGLLEYPHWTRPREYKGMKVPDVLLSGDHKQIKCWRKREAIRRTLRLRPELLVNLRKDDLVYLKQIIIEEGYKDFEKLPDNIKKRIQEEMKNGVDQSSGT